MAYRAFGHMAHMQLPEQCHCDAIKRNYGTRPFKCPYVSCMFHRIGFGTKKLRRAHSGDHDRPWRCDVPACEYGEIGFLSRQMREVHLNRFHMEDPEESIWHAPTNNDQLVSFLLGLVRADKVNSIQSVLATAQDLNYDQIEALFVEAATSGSSNMIEIIGPRFLKRINEMKDIFSQVLLPAVAAGNLETSKWLATRLQPLAEASNPYLDSIFAKVLRSDKSVALYNCIKPIVIIAYTKQNAKITNSNAAFSPLIISATRGRPQSERILITLWRKLNDMGFVPRKYLGTGLQSVASTTCSITLASALLDLGANSEYRVNINQARPLQRAAQHGTEEAAKFLMYLLYRGANPNVSYDQLRKRDGHKGHGLQEKDGYKDIPKLVSTEVWVSEEDGAKGISKWLKKSWEDLVAEAAEARRYSDNPPIPED